MYINTKLDEKLSKEILKLMGYRNVSISCSTCRYFTEFEGEPDKGLCSRNAFKLEVDTGGSCICHERCLDD